MSLRKTCTEKKVANKRKFKAWTVVLLFIFLLPLIGTEWKFQETLTNILYVVTVVLFIYAVARKKGEKNEPVE